MRLRQGAAAVSLLGIGVVAATVMLQMGIVRHLLDPPVRGPDTVKVNTLDGASSYGGPDHAWRHPWLPLLAAAVEAPQTAVAVKYRFHQMPQVD